MNRLFQTYKQALLTGTALDLTSADLRVVAVDTGVHDPDTTINGDEFLSDIPVGARITTSPTLTGTAVVNAILDAEDVTMPDSGGATYEELVLYVHTGDPATSRLLVCFDTASGLPLTPDNVDDLLRWNASGIFAL